MKTQGGNLHRLPPSIIKTNLPAKTGTLLQD